jgi:hypothetical protein
VAKGGTGSPAPLQILPSNLSLSLVIQSRVFAAKNPRGLSLDMLLDSADLILPQGAPPWLSFGEGGPNIDNVPCGVKASWSPLYIPK